MIHVGPSDSARNTTRKSRITPERRLIVLTLVLACVLGQFGGGVNRVGGVIDPTTGLPRFAIRDANGGLVSAGAFVPPNMLPRETSTKSISTKSATAAKAKPKTKRVKIKPRSANERIALKRELMWAVIGL
jgi:hypothetical protein